MPILDAEISKRQRIHPTPYIVDEQALYALPTLEKAPVWVASNAPKVLARRLNIDMPTVIMKNAADYI